MKILMALFLLSGFCFKSPGIVYKLDKAYDPSGKIVQDFDRSKRSYDKEYYYFLENHNDYPWGVCFPEGKHNFEQKHLNWTWTAMEAWNKEYDKFISIHKHNTLFPFRPLRFPFDVSRISFDPRDYFVVAWPDPESKLLVWSCDKEKYNLVYPVFAPTKVNEKTKIQPLAYYDAKHPWFGDFYGSIVMSNNVKEKNGKIKVWEEHHFINVMMHELGHLLGVPHLKPDETEIMTSYGFGCGKRGKDKICSLTSGDFNSFVSIFRSRGKHIRELSWSEKEKFRELKGWEKEKRRRDVKAARIARAKLDTEKLRACNGGGYSGPYKLLDACL